jgi:hypothetical protein
MDEEAIFTAALELESADQRAAYLAEACAGRTDLRRKVEELLTAHGRAAQFLDNAAVAWNAQLATCDQPAPAERPGTLIGPYKLLEQIGEGGMGLSSWRSRPSRYATASPSRCSSRAWNTRQLTERTLFTQFAQMVGTPLYMSPRGPAGERIPLRQAQSVTRNRGLSTRPPSLPSSPFSAS